MLDEQGNPMTREIMLEEYLAHASFQRSLWTIGPIQSEMKQGNLCGGDVLRLFHGRMSDDCLCNPDVADTAIDPDRKTIFYEGGPVSTHARSLWRIELTKIKWSGSHIRIGQPFRLRHMCSGKFLRLVFQLMIFLGLALAKASDWSEILKTLKGLLNRKVLNLDLTSSQWTTQQSFALEHLKTRLIPTRKTNQIQWAMLKLNSRNL